MFDNPTTSVIPSLGFLTPQGLIVETVYNPITKNARFVYLDDTGQVQYCPDQYEVRETGEVFVPYKHPFLEEDCLILPSDYQDPGDTKKLVLDIRNFILKYVDVSVQYSEIMARYVLFTWTFRKWSTLGYLRFLGQPGTGKTRCLDTLRALCYRSLFLGAAVTEANIFRTNTEVRGTLFMDEFNLEKSSFRNSMIQILNNGSGRGGAIFRTNKEYRPEAFTAFGPKILANHSTFDDPATESRMLTIVFREKTRKDLPLNLPEYTRWEEATNLRNRLLGFMLQNQSENMPEREVMGLDHFSHRFADNIRPLFQVTGEVVIPGDLEECFHNMEDQVNATRPYEEVAIGRYICNRWKAEDITSVSPNEISRALRNDDAEISSRAVGEILRRLGLHSKKTRNGYLYAVKEEDVMYISKILSLN
ncbi:MAG: hypothetical protein ACYC3H_10880 [Bellilinea sp.]